MKITIIGAGAAGLSSGILLKSLLDADITILERASESETLGLGVGLLQFSINELRMISLQRFLSYEEHFRSISRITSVFAGQSRQDGLLRKTRIQDTDYWGVKRSILMSLLKDAAQNVGITLEYDMHITEDRVRQAQATSDLLVGADGAGSVVRNTYAEEFHPRASEAKSRYAWLALEGNVGQFEFGYIDVAGKGLIRISAYPHSKDESSAIVTHSMGLAGTFDAAGMTDSDGAISAMGMSAINDLFSQGLGGRKLSGKSRWRRFRATHGQRAAFGNVALVGDAFATLHYETGWGTSAALQESRILVNAMLKGKTVGDGLAIYDWKSREICKGLITATAKTMREIDAQGATFRKLGAARFLESKTP